LYILPSFLLVSSSKLHAPAVRDVAVAKTINSYILAVGHGPTAVVVEVVD